MYNYSQDNPALNRRVYSLLDENKKDIILVHYFTRAKTNTREDNAQASKPVEDMDTDDEARHDDCETATATDDDDDAGDESELQSDSDDDRADPDYDIDNSSDTDTEEDHTLDTDGLVDEIADASLCAGRQDGKGEERAPRQPAESQLKAVSGLLNMVVGVDKNDIQKKMRQQRKQIRDTAVVPDSVAIEQLAQEAANKDLSDKLQKLDVAAAEPSIYSTPVRNHYGDPGASGSRQPAQPGRDRSMPPPAAVPATAITKSGGIKDLVDTKLKMYLEAEVKVPILEKKVQVLQSELEAAKAEINTAKKQVDAAVEAAVKANDAEHAIKLKDISEKHKAAERVWQQRLEAAKANAVAAQRHADKISQEANELKEQIQEKDTALAAQKKQCKKRTRAHLRDMEVERRNAASSAKKYQKIEEKLCQRVKDLTRVEEEDSQGPTETDSSDDSDAESHIESSSASGS